MVTLLPCTSCQAKLQVNEGLSGKRVKCPKCGQILNVPLSSGIVESRPSGAADNPGQPKAPAFRSIADEIRKLQDLRDEGVLTEDEFAMAKASILASLAAPAAASPRDDKAVRLKEQLAQFKTKLEGVDEESIRSVLEQAEDLLIAVCGQDRYRGFMDVANTISRLQDDIREARKDGDREGRREYQRRLEQEYESLKRRVASIEYWG